MTKAALPRRVATSLPQETSKPARFTAPMRFAAAANRMIPRDLSGNNFHALPGGSVSLVPALYNGVGLQSWLPGAGGSGSIPLTASALRYDSPITMLAIVKPPSTSTFNIRTSSTTGSPLIWQLSSTGLQTLTISGVGSKGSTVTAIPLGSFTAIICQYTPGTTGGTKFYFPGTTQTVAGSTGNATTGTGPVISGGGTGAGQCALYVEWDGILTDAECRALLTNPFSAFESNAPYSNRSRLQVRTSPVRYVRDSANGSDVDPGVFWSEIQAFDVNGVALANSASQYTFSQAVDTSSVANIPYLYDGLMNTNGVIISGAGVHTATLDLGSIVQVSKVRIGHYPTATFHNTKTEISPDGQTWYTLYDSTVSGEYVETTSGKNYLPPSYTYTAPVASTPPTLRTDWFNATESTNLSVVTSTTAHDVLIAYAASDNNNTNFTFPSGFTALQQLHPTYDASVLNVGIKQDASGSEGTLTLTSPDAIIGGVLAFSNVDNVTSLDVAAQGVLGSGGPDFTATASLTTVTNGCLLVAIVDEDVANPVSVTSTTVASSPALTWTKVRHINNGAYANVSVFTATQTTKGAISVTSTSTGYTGQSGIVLLALRPATTAAAGTTYPVSITEAVTASDTNVSNGSLPVTLSEAAVAADSLSAIKTAPASISEAGTAANTATASTVAPVTISEAATAADSSVVIKTAPASISESATAAESSTRTTVSPTAISEPATAADAVATTNVSVVNSAEAVTAAEGSDALVVRAVSIAESATASDSSTNTVVLGVPVTAQLCYLEIDWDTHDLGIYPGRINAIRLLDAQGNNLLIGATWNSNLANGGEKSTYTDGNNIYLVDENPSTYADLSSYGNAGASDYIGWSFENSPYLTEDGYVDAVALEIDWSPAPGDSRIPNFYIYGYPLEGSDFLEINAYTPDNFANGLTHIDLPQITDIPKPAVRGKSLRLEFSGLEVPSNGAASLQIFWLYGTDRVNEPVFSNRTSGGSTTNQVTYSLIKGSIAPDHDYGYTSGVMPLTNINLGYDIVHNTSFFAAIMPDPEGNATIQVDTVGGLLYRPISFNVQAVTVNQAATGQAQLASLKFFITYDGIHYHQQYYTDTYEILTPQEPAYLVNGNFSNDFLVTPFAEETITGTIYAVGVSENAGAYDDAVVSAQLPVTGAEAGSLVDAATASSVLLVVTNESATASESETAAASKGAAITETATLTDSESNTVAASAAISEAGALSDSENSTAVKGAAISEAGTLADAETVTLVAVSVVSEPLTGSDASTVQMQNLASVSEAGSANDQSATGANAVAVAASESATPADSSSVAAIDAASVSESGSLVDAPSVTASFVSATTESATSVDSQTVSGVRPASTSEAATASDSNTAGTATSASNSESGSAADTTVAAKTTNSAISEPLTASDTESVSAVVVAANTESGAASDALTVTAINLVAVSEPLSASESVTLLAAGTVTITETVALVEATSVNVAGTAAITEAGGAADAPVGLRTTNAAASEAVTPSDSESVSAIMVATETEPATASESSSLTQATTASTTEALAADHTQVLLAAGTVTVVEVLNAAEAPTAAATVNSAVTESGNPAESVAATAVMPANTTEPASAAEQVAQGSVVNGNTSEAAAPTDASAPTLSSTRNVTESANALESVSNTAALGVSVAEAAISSDTLVVSAQYLVAQAEAATLADAAIGGYNTNAIVLNPATAGDSVDGQKINDAGAAITETLVPSEQSVTRLDYGVNVTEVVDSDSDASVQMIYVVSQTELASLRESVYVYFLTEHKQYPLAGKSSAFPSASKATSYPLNGQSIVYPSSSKARNYPLYGKNRSYP